MRRRGLRARQVGGRGRRCSVCGAAVAGCTCRRDGLHRNHAAACDSASRSTRRGSRGVVRPACEQLGGDAARSPRPHFGGSTASATDCGSADDDGRLRTSGPSIRFSAAVEVAVFDPFQDADVRRIGDRADGVLLIQRKSCRCGSCSRLPVLNWVLRWPVSGLTSLRIRWPSTSRPSANVTSATRGGPEHAKPLTMTTASRMNTRDSIAASAAAVAQTCGSPRRQKRADAVSRATPCAVGDGMGPVIHWRCQLCRRSRRIACTFPKGDGELLRQNRPKRFRSRWRTSSAAVFTVNVKETAGPHRETGRDKAFRRRAPRESPRRCWPRASACR